MSLTTEFDGELKCHTSGSEDIPLLYITITTDRNILKAIMNGVMRMCYECVWCLIRVKGSIGNPQHYETTNSSDGSSIKSLESM